MWESLPPVAQSSTVAADAMTGISVATHTSGMINGGGLSNSQQHNNNNNNNIGNSSTAAASNTSGTTPYTASLSTPLPSAARSLSGVPVMPPVVNAAPASQQLTFNPFATPREASLTSTGGAANTTTTNPPTNMYGSAGSRESSARSSVAGGVGGVGAGAGGNPPASSQPYFPPGAATATTPSSFSAVQGGTNALQRGFSMDAADVRQGSNAASLDAAATGISSRTSRDTYGIPSLTGSNTGPAPAPPLSHPRTLSASSVPYAAPRPPPPPTQTFSSQQQQQQQQQMSVPSSGTNRTQGLAVSPLPPPTAQAAASPMYYTTTSTTNTHMTPSASRRLERAASSSVSQTTTTAAATSTISRSVSPRHPHPSLHNASASSPAATSITPSSHANAAWQSPGSISLSSARLNNDPTSLYFSPERSEVVVDGGVSATVSGCGDAAVRTLASANRTAAPPLPSERRLHNPFSPTLTTGKGTVNVNTNTYTSMASLISQPGGRGEAGSPLTDVHAAGVGAFTRLPAALATPTHTGDAAAGSAMASSARQLGTATMGAAETPDYHSNSNSMSSSSGNPNNNNNTRNNNASGSVVGSVVSGTSLTFVSPHFQTACGAGEDSLMTPTMPVTVQGGLALATPAAATTTVAPAGVGLLQPVQSQYAVPSNTQPPTLMRVPQPPLPPPSALPAQSSQAAAAGTTANTTTTAVSTTTNSKTVQPHSVSASVSRSSASAGGRLSNERTSAELVRVVGTDNAASASSLPSPPPPPTTVTAAAAAAAARERAADMRPRYVMPPGVFTTPPTLSSGTPPSMMLAPAGGPSAGLMTPPQPSTTPRSALAHAHPQTPPQDGLHARPTLHVSIAAASPSSPPPPPPQMSQGLSPSYHLHGTNSVGDSYNVLHGTAAMAGSHTNVAAGGSAEFVHASLVSGSIDHNQSFYMGTTGNDNLRRSFFFPSSARVLSGERDDVVEGGSGDEVNNGHSFDLASYLRHSATAPRSTSVDRPSVSGGLPSAGSMIVAVNAGVNCVSPPGPPSGPPPPLASPSAPAISARSATNASVAATEATEGEGGYCSPVLYRVSSFPPNSSLQPSASRGGGGGAPAMNSPAPSGLVRGPSSQFSVSPQQPQQPQSPPQQLPMQAPPMSNPFAAGALPAGATSATQPPQRSLPEEPLRISIAQRPRANLPNTSTSASSPHTTTIATSAHVTQLADSLRHATNNTNTSFISPTLANSMLRQRFEDSMVAGSEASFALPESSAHMAASRVNLKNAAGPGVARRGSDAKPLSAQSSTTVGGSSNASLPNTPQKHTAAPAPAAAAPAYVMDWERSLIAFQNRAESYYTFKNLCTETYLTLIEHDVDRFLVCYYSGGAVKPEEAVQEALASRASTPAAASVQVLSSTGASAASPSGANGGNNNNNSNTTRSGLQKMIQTNKTLQKLSETGSKWFTNLKKTAMTPVPVWGEPKTPASSAGSATPKMAGRSVTSSANSSTAADPLAATRVLLTPGAPHPPSAPANNTMMQRTGTAGVGVSTAGMESGGEQAGGEGGEEKWWTSAHDRQATNDSVEPTFSIADPSNTRNCPNTDTDSSYQGSAMHRRDNTSSTSSTTNHRHPNTNNNFNYDDCTAMDSHQLLERPLSSSGRSVDALSATSSGVTCGTPKKPPPSRLSYNIAAEAELQCLRRLGGYMANVIPESYMDRRPSEQVLQHVRRNYGILLHALQHVLLMSGVDNPLAEEVAAAAAPPSDTTAAAAASYGLPSATSASQAAKALISSRIRQGLLVPSIQATWRDYLAPLEMKVKELVQIATDNIDPILEELQAVPTDAAAAVAFGDGAGERGRAAEIADLEARQRLRALREQPVRRLARLLRGDEEYLTTIHTMDDEFMEDGEAWRERSAAMRRTGAALSDYVPVYGLVLSRLHRLEIEHRTVLELWCGGVQAAMA